MNLFQPLKPPKTCVSLDLFIFFFQVCRTKVIDLSEGISQHAWYPCTMSYPYSQLAQTTFWVRVSQSFESHRLSSRGPWGSIVSLGPFSGWFCLPTEGVNGKAENKTVSSRMLLGMESLNCSWDAFSQSCFGPEFRYHLDVVLLNHLALKSSLSPTGRRNYPFPSSPPHVVICWVTLVMCRGIL